ncbi:MAG: DUF3089 domain-containing protein [Pseudomonadales bacterium]
MTRIYSNSFVRMLLPAMLATLLIACSDTETQEDSTQSADQAKSEAPAMEDAKKAEEGGEGQGAADYSNPKNWLCRPDLDGDACVMDLTTTVVAADGTMTREPFTRNPRPPIDCFYVYPTVSTDETPNSDMKAGPGEISVIRAQFARFGEVCRTFAPLYRQVTLTALRARRAGEDMQVDRALAYNDVKAAWDHYLAHDNDGRGVVLIGHSQGSGVLTRLISNEIDGQPVQDKVISALLIGTRLPVPAGERVGGAFEHMPLCSRSDETGCVVTYASFRDDIPPPDESLFGRVEEEGMIAACTNPASLSGGSGELHAYLSTEGPGMNSAEPEPWVEGEEVTTPFVSLPGMLTAQCVNDDRGSYLSVSVHGDPEDPRADDIVGDVVVEGEVQTGWGLHLIDMHLAMGNLINIVKAQAEAYRKEQDT